MKTVCSYKHRELFTKPTGRDTPATERAIQMCESCPALKQCAEMALVGGSSIDMHNERPATGVIQAGVYCDGSDRATWELMAAAGRVERTLNVGGGLRPKALDRCRSCDKPMVRWTRDRVPEGYVMHRGRGFCTNCRKAYDRELARARAAGETRMGLRKQIDRKRHSAPPRRDREVVIQFALFEQRELLG